MAEPDYENKALALLREIRDQLALVRGELEQINDSLAEDGEDEDED